MIKHRVEFEGDVFSALFTWVAGGADPVSPSIEGFVERHVAQFVPASAHRLLAQPAGTPADCGSMETTLASSSSMPEWRLRTTPLPAADSPDSGRPQAVFGLARGRAGRRRRRCGRSRTSTGSRGAWTGRCPGRGHVQESEQLARVDGIETAGWLLV